MNNVSNKLEAEDTHVGLIKFKKANCTIGLTTALKPNDLKASIEIFLSKKLLDYQVCAVIMFLLKIMINQNLNIIKN